jgi:hypothetical protein
MQQRARYYGPDTRLLLQSSSNTTTVREVEGVVPGHLARERLYIKRENDSDIDDLGWRTRKPVMREAVWAAASTVDGTQRLNSYLNVVSIPDGFSPTQIYARLVCLGGSQAGTKGRGWWWNHSGEGYTWSGMGWHFGAHDSCSLAAIKLWSRGWITLGEWDQAIKGRIVFLSQEIRTKTINTGRHEAKSSFSGSGTLEIALER